MLLHRTIDRIGFVATATFTGYGVYSQCIMGTFRIAAAFYSTFHICWFSFIVLCIWLAIKCRWDAFTT